MFAPLEPQKRCEVCGGSVKPFEERSGLGYCEKCGLVYAMIIGTEDVSSFEHVGPRVDSSEEETEAVVSTGPETTNSRNSPNFKSKWRCPDCESEIISENETDLEYLKREHIREYHPNRSAG